ncbi:SRPBCC family protein [Plantactinospora sp. B6F1]|uniref:SRPBCC family protein n=1 Tax=Plantactinospora sp. B6F1 TaxID=3158971 RepID=UPI00102B0173
MPLVIVDAQITGHRVEQVYDTVADFARYPELVDTVRSVEVDPPEPDGSVASTWSVLFRNGILRWREVDRFDRDALRIWFEQTEGEFDVFRGEWSLKPDRDVVRLLFQAEFDFGVASLAPIIDPVATRVLTESMQTILRGLFGPDSVRFAVEANPVA